jgi:hypothetical protein
LGHVLIRGATGVIPDARFTNSQFGFYIQGTTFMVKYKTPGGTVKTGVLGTIS